MGDVAAPLSPRQGAGDGGGPTEPAGDGGADAGGGPHLPCSQMSRAEVVKLLTTQHGSWNDPGSFHSSRVKALGMVLHSDVDMWPFNLRGEHNEVLPHVVADILESMGYKADDRHVQMVLDEVTECQRLVKGFNTELLGAGKIGETLRQVNQIRSAARDYGGQDHTKVSALDLLPCLEGLHELFSAEFDREQSALESGDLSGAALIRAQHEHPEFAACTDAILEALVSVKRLAKRRIDNEKQIRICNEVVTRCCDRFVYTQRHIAAPCPDLEALLQDSGAAGMWTACFGGRLSSSVDSFVTSFQEYTHSPQPFIAVMAAGLMDECLDGIASIWAFSRLMALFGPFRDVVHNLGAEALGGYLAYRLAECEGAAAVGNTPGNFVLIPAGGAAELRCVWVDHQGVQRTTLVSRATGAWQSGLGGAPSETLRDLVEAQPRWTTPCGESLQGLGLPGPQQAAFQEGTSPLHRACTSNNAGMVKVLLKHGGTLTSTLRTWASSGEFSSSLTALMLCATNTVGCPLEIARMLLRAGADVNARDARGESVLYKAILHNRPGLIELLHGAGAERFAADGTDPLILAMGPSHENGWLKHDVALQGYRPSLPTVKALLLFYCNPDDADAVEAARKVAADKIKQDCSPPPGSIHLHRLEKAELAQQHALRHIDAFRPIKRLLCEHATALRTKKDLLG